MKIDQLIGNAKTIGIAGHVRPDGDAIGSSLGMYLYLKKNYPETRVDVFLEKVLPELTFISGSDKVKTDFATDVESYDLFIVVDCSKDRIGDAEKFFDAAKRTINIDHHISNPGTGDDIYIVPDASSACELVYDTLDPSRINVEIAKALYTGMVTDTGVFKYNNTSPKTM
ncbi:MAG: DHH family phosphoesterase, partial [Butyrivibrio sp.]|nr:DHH family phosphoesterase [Butyrivibrio sp.]